MTISPIEQKLFWEIYSLGKDGNKNESIGFGVDYITPGNIGVVTGVDRLNSWNVYTEKLPVTGDYLIEVYGDDQLIYQAKFNYSPNPDL